MSKQTHIFATRSDFELGLAEFESRMDVKYARCDLYYGPVYEQYLSLLDWNDLGKNTTGDHMSGPCFLVVPRNCKINVEAVPQTVPQRASVTVKAANQVAWLTGGTGATSQQPASFEQYLTNLDKQSETCDQDPLAQIRYDVSQKLNPHSITFRVGGIYRGEKILVCGHKPPATAMTRSAILLDTPIPTA
jgi:hypothetical protein